MEKRSEGRQRSAHFCQWGCLLRRVQSRPSRRVWKNEISIGKLIRRFLEAGQEGWEGSDELVHNFGKIRRTLER
jgi:hypothetical protein